MNSDQQSTLVLVKPSEQYEDEILAYRDEFIQSDDGMHGTAGLDDANTFGEWLKNVRNDENEETVQEGYVPASEYLAIREKDKRLVGMVSIRHRLNDFLQFQGGHIGYSVRASERRKGYATEILKKALLICRELGINRVLLTCDKDNSGSVGVIKANDGVLQEEFTSHEGTPMQRYWINIS